MKTRNHFALFAMVFSPALFLSSVDYAAAVPDFTQTAPSARYDNGIVYIEQHWPDSSILMSMTHYEVIQRGGGTLFTIEYHENGTFKEWTSYHWSGAQPERVI